MQSEEKKHLENLIKPLLKKKGFRKRGSTWWRHSDDFIQVVNIQGSQWSKNFYINLGIYIRDLGDKQWPAEEQCHIRHSLESIYGVESGIVKLLNYEDYAPEALPRKRLSEMLEQGGLNWLEECSNFQRAKSEYQLPNRVITKWQRQLLDKLFAQR